MSLTKATPDFYSEMRSGIKRDRHSGDQAVFNYPKLSTFYGYVRATEPKRLVIPTDPAHAMTMACRVDREADAELQAGNHYAADRLGHLAYELRARAAGGRAA